MYFIRRAISETCLFCYSVAAERLLVYNFEGRVEFPIPYSKKMYSILLSVYLFNNKPLPSLITCFCHSLLFQKVVDSMC